METIDVEVYYVVRYFTNISRPRFVAGPLAFDDAVELRRKCEDKGFGGDYRIVTGSLRLENV